MLYAVVHRFLWNNWTAVINWKGFYFCKTFGALPFLPYFSWHTIIFVERHQTTWKLTWPCSNIWTWISHHALWSLGSSCSSFVSLTLSARDLNPNIRGNTGEVRESGRVVYIWYLFSSQLHSHFHFMIQLTSWGYSR